MMHSVAKVFGFLLAELGDGVYANGAPHTPANKLVGIYDSMTLPKFKSRVWQSFKENVGQVRIVIATSPLSMGVNFPDIRYVVHIGPFRSLIDHIQEAGRAGRDGKQAHNVILYHEINWLTVRNPSRNLCVPVAVFERLFLKSLLWSFL